MGCYLTLNFVYVAHRSEFDIEVKFDFHTSRDGKAKTIFYSLATKNWHRLYHTSGTEDGGYVHFSVFRLGDGHLFNDNLAIELLYDKSGARVMTNHLKYSFFLEPQD